MHYIFSHDRESMAFQPLMVRSRLTLGGKAVKLNPGTLVKVSGSAGYEGKVLIRDAELTDKGLAHRFLVELLETFTLQEYQSLILGRKPLFLLVTLFPDLALPLPTAGVPLPVVSPAITGNVDVAMPEATIGRIEALIDPDSPLQESDLHLKARVHLPPLIANRAELERKYTAACRFVPASAELTLAGTAVAGEWVQAHFVLAPAATPGPREPITVPVRVTVDIDGTLLECQVFVTVHAARQLELVLSHRQIRTSLHKATSLSARAIEVFRDGRRIQADDAEITISLPEVLARIVAVTPNIGQGSLVAAITQSARSSLPSGKLLIEARVEEGVVQESIPLNLVAGRYDLTVEPLPPDNATTAYPWCIRWDEQLLAWRCDPARLLLHSAAGNGQTPEAIDKLEMLDANGWLGIESLQNEAEAGCLVRFRVKPDKYHELTPPIHGDAVLRVAAEPLPAETMRPMHFLSTRVTFTAHRAQMGPCATAQAELIVEPPTVHWTLDQTEPIPLSGAAGRWHDIVIRSGRLPSGWLRGAEMLFGFSDPNAARRMGLHLRLKPEVTSLRTDPGEPAVLRGVVEIMSSIPCFKKVPVIPDPAEPDELCLLTATRGDYHGQTAARIHTIDIQPQLLALYLGPFPCQQYPWTEARRQIQLVRADLATPTDWSQLPLSIRYLEGWPEPPVRWQLTAQDPPLADRFDPTVGVRTRYTAPRQESELAASKPQERRF
ncbi:MAG: hypothetical protein EOM92_12335, partial [Gammaproteobacteria bacterium]|nr:hypothetical protein [Gammaproteobacteria bacterium]